jgi:hypothetical protein
LVPFQRLSVCHCLVISAAVSMDMVCSPLESDSRAVRQ